MTIRSKTILYAFFGIVAFLVGFMWGMSDAHAHGPTPFHNHANNPYLVCHDLSRLQPVHCSTLDPVTRCCRRWHYNHAAPPAPSFQVDGKGQHCVRSIAASRAAADARRKCSPGAWTLTPALTQFSGYGTNACAREASDPSTNLRGWWDIVTVRGQCQR